MDVIVAVGVGVSVKTGVLVGVSVTAGVSVDVGVAVNVGVSVGVLVGAGVFVGVGVTPKDELRGLGVPTVKSALLSLVSVEPFALRNAAVVELGAGAGMMRRRGLCSRTRIT